MNCYGARLSTETAISQRRGHSSHKVICSSLALALWKHFPYPGVLPE